MSTAKPLITMISVIGEDYRDAAIAAEGNGGSITAVVGLGHLRTLAGNGIEGRTTLGHPAASNHQLHHVIWGHTHYWLQINHQRGLYALYRIQTPEDDTTA